MLQYLKRRWKYLTAKLSGRFEENADPKVQLEQAIREANEQHRRLKEQAANVIANQKQTEMRLNRAIEDLEKVNGNARQAVVMAEDAAAAADTEKAASYTAAAEQFANRLISLEQEIESLKSLHFQASEAADQAKAAVKQNSSALQKKLGERQKLLGQLDQAKMQEQVNDAMATLSEEVGQDVPTFNEVREKIEARYAKAKGTAELVEGGMESRMLEIEEAARNTEARARLAEIKTQLGIGAGESAAGELPKPDQP
jgi:phage shock protein A